MPVSHANTPQNKLEIETQAALEAEAAQQSRIGSKRSLFKDNKILTRVKDVMKFRGRDSRQRESSIYDDSKPLLSDSIDEKMETEREIDLSMSSEGLKKDEGKLLHTSKIVPY